MRARTALLASAVLAGCLRTRPAPEVPQPPRLSVSEVAARIPKHVEDREGWAGDVLAALDAVDRHPTAEAVCQVLAILEQESGYQANPVVPDLPRIARRELEASARRFGPLGRTALDELLAARVGGRGRTFGERLGTLKTERDLDLLFRDALAHLKATYPKTYAAANAASWLSSSRTFADANPVTTAGSMQVSVRWAEEHAARQGEDEQAVRDSLYTRAGGVRYGTARLFGFDAAYAQPLFRFGDYNAGPFSSRNAALQEQLSVLTGAALALDGDLLAYDKAGEPRSDDSRTLIALLDFRARYAPELSERQVRSDARLEKSEGLEGSATWRAVRRAYEAKTGRHAAYARLPDVSLKSPKLKKDRSTAWFARSVNARYLRCLER